MIFQNKEQTKKKKLRIVFTSFLVLLFVFIIVIIIMLFTRKPKEFIITNVDLSNISDGVYTGSADNGLVKASVSVEVKNRLIKNITLLEHDNLLGKSAEKIVDTVIEQQTLDVDAVTSATYSSTTILKAIENALTHQTKE